MMQVIVLGGAAACPNPGQGCSAYLVRHADSQILLDCGPDTLQELGRHTALDKLDAIVISHVHSDHTLDLVPLRYGLKYGRRSRPDRIPLFLPPGGSAFLARLAAVFAMGDEDPDAFFYSVFAPREFDPNVGLQAGPFAISFHSTEHFIPCWAINVTAGGRRLTYLSDTGPSGPLTAFASESDLLICEAAYGDMPVSQVAASGGHLTARQAGRFATESGSTRMVLTHLWSRFDDADMRRLASEEFSGDIVIARPGLQIEV